jgi:hypothetical protein
MLLFRKLKNKSMKLLNIISGPIKDGNTNDNLAAAILVLINYRSKNI